MRPKSRYAFLATGRWLGIVLLALAVSLACIGLGIWQWQRHETRSAHNAAIEANYNAAPRPLDVARGPGGGVGVAEEWQPVRVRGSYEGDQLALRNRPVDGTSATRVLAAFTTDDGQDLVVDRGWLEGTSPNELPAYPDGEVELLARLRQPEAPDDRRPPAGQVYAINPSAVFASAAGTSSSGAFDGYLMAATEDSQAPGGLQAFPEPAVDPGPHLSYAFQWWLFALGAQIGLVILARREAADQAQFSSLAPTSHPQPAGGRDAEEEDAIIDAQLGSPPRPPQASATSSS